MQTETFYINDTDISIMIYALTRVIDSKKESSKAKADAIKAREKLEFALASGGNLPEA